MMLRSIAKQIARPTAIGAPRAFHGSTIRAIKVGDKVPNVPLSFEKPSEKVDLAKETASGKFLVVGVPGAFSPACTADHVPGYISSVDKLRAKSIKKLFVIAVNDAFVTKAWAHELLKEQPSETQQFVTFLADPEGTFSKAWDVLFDATAVFGQPRSKRYAALVENGQVKDTFVEPTNAGVDVSDAKHVLPNI